MKLALEILQAINTLGPGVAELVLLIRKKDGTIAVMPMLDEADQQFGENIKSASDWLAERGYPVADR